MEQDEFQDEVLQRLTKIETLFGEQDKACIVCAGSFHEEIKELKGKTDEQEKAINGLNIKAAAVGAVVSILAYLGLTNLGPLASLLSGK